METLNKLFKSTATHRVPSRPPEIADGQPEADQGAVAELRFALLSLLQNTHPQGTSIDEVLADSRMVLERGGVVEGSSAIPSTLTPTAIQERLQRLVESPSSKEDVTSSLFHRPTPPPESSTSMTRVWPRNQ